jgi:GR25 family glycosyltransferase involved in LPS biosynthesis
MANPFDFFEEIYCINLDHRTDRWANVQKEFEKLGIKDRVQRFSALKRPDGRIGLIKSTLEILKISRKKGLENVLILEDDVTFINNPLQNLELAINQLKENNFEWQLFYLGANTHNKLNKVTPNLILLRNAFATHSLAYHKSIYKKVIDYATVTDKIITIVQVLDVWLSTVIQSNNKTYMVNPIITTQIESYSDIEKKVINYDYIEERFKTNIK